jgi:hypothetical protein
MTCKKAIGVAERMKEKYGDTLDLKIHKTDSEEAKPFNFRSATNVVVDNKIIPLDVATDEKSMEEFLAGKV